MQMTARTTSPPNHAPRALNALRANIQRTLDLLAGDPNRWRAHIKTAKLAHTLRMLIDRGFTLVRPLAGGFDAWVGAGYPVEEL